MNPAKAPLAVPAWPPLITAVRVRWWLRIRDILVTLVGWGLFGWLLRDPIYLAYDYLRPPIFRLTVAEPLDVFILWLRLRYFWVIIAGLLAWLCLWGLVRIRRLPAAQPPPLTAEEQAGWAGLGKEKVNQARKFNVTNVRFNDDGSIADFEKAIR